MKHYFKETREMAGRFALLYLAHWQQAKGLPNARAEARKQFLFWRSVQKGVGHAA
jgi:hypothetical protein